MRKILIAVLMFGCLCATLSADTRRVAVLDFENKAGASADYSLVGVTSDDVAGKGVYVLESLLANEDSFKLIDRRDFIGRIESEQTRAGRAAPSFLRAAQALNADVVLRGVLLSWLPAKQSVDQAGFKAEFVALTVRVALQALDTLDGSIVASAEAASSLKLRQTDSLKTVVGEDEVLELLRSAVVEAVPKVVSSLEKRAARDKQRQTVKLSLKTNADPALVELDGILIGTTPLIDFEAYKGDHVLTIGKAGYRDVNKRVAVDQDMSIEVPLLRTELTADELKQVLETMRMNVVVGVPEPPIVINAISAE